MGLLAFDLDDVTAAHIEDGFDETEKLTTFIEASRLVIQAIHSLPGLFEDAHLGKIEVYLGRAAFTAAHVQARFREHRKEKGHQHGVVLFSTTQARAVRWEGWANRILMYLHEIEKLCVANAAAGGHGGKSEDIDESCIYLTWRMVRERDIDVPDDADVVETAEHLSSSTKRSISFEDAQEALDPVTRPRTEKLKIEWHKEHA